MVTNIELLKEKYIDALTVIKETEVMRNRQKMYFKHRDRDSLQKAKMMESKVDRMIRDFKNPAKQQSIF